MSEPVAGGHVTGAAGLTDDLDNAYILTAAQARAAGLVAASDE